MQIVICCVCGRILHLNFSADFLTNRKKRSIRSLHQAFLEGNPNRKVLEISSRSEEELGVSLSAFHLMLHTAEGKEYTVESAFQAGKVFENGGPYRDCWKHRQEPPKRTNACARAAELLRLNIMEKGLQQSRKHYFIIGYI